MKGSQAGRSADIGRIYTVYADMVYRLAVVRCGNHHDADDVFQEVFVRLAARPPAFESEAHCRAWLVRVTINCSKKLVGSAWRRNTQLMDDQFFFSDDHQSDVWAAVAALPPKYRTAIHLHYYEGYSAEEIGRMTGCSASAVRTQLQRGHAQLREQLEGGFEDER